MDRRWIAPVAFRYNGGFVKIVALDLGDQYILHSDSSSLGWWP